MKRDAKAEPITSQEGLSRIYRYCAYQERSHHEVRGKLFSYGLIASDVDRIVSQLILDGFLNEERFARAFAGGKFRTKKWGRNKIVHALQGQGLTQNCIQSGLQEIEGPDYNKTLKDLIRKKSVQNTDENLFRKRDKVARFAIAKGYEPELVWEFVKDLLPD